MNLKAWDEAPNEVGAFGPGILREAEFGKRILWMPRRRVLRRRVLRAGRRRVPVVSRTLAGD
ncbi:MAG: hypothetical protein AAF715_08295 [Myxococcota bacterium]